MGQFPMTESRRKVLERIPDYAVDITPTNKLITVKFGDLTIAESVAALLIQETRHDDVYYLPMSDVEMSLLTSTDLSTYCPFKGHASYWSLGEDLTNFVWSYLDPYPEVADIKDYLSFYPNQVQIEAK